MSAKVYFDDVMRETESAVLLDLGEDDDKWIPKSVIEGDIPEERGGPGSVMIAEWYALKYGLC